MKVSPTTHIYDLWATGGGDFGFVGDDAAPHAVVTVEKGWVLRRSATPHPGPGNGYDRGPIRWFQRTNNGQVEQPLSNIRSIDINRSVDADAADCTIVLSNQKMLSNGVIVTGTAGESFGQPGFYWPGRGDSGESQTRWGWDQNVNWNDILVPNALIRTYQGYGGRNKTLDEALADGNLVQTGLWLVDGISQSASTGDFTLKCRDMAKLLIDQMIYPPLVPKQGAAHYPLNYYRWVYVNHPVIPYGTTVYKTGLQVIEGGDSMNTAASSSETGHLSGQAVDGNDPDSFWVSSGHTVDTAFEYVQFNFDPTLVEGINIQPYAGNYKMYVSVWTGGPGGGWEAGKGNIPSPNGALAIGYVQVVGVGWEHAATFDLGGSWPGATRIRLTFTHLAPTSIGGAKSFRAGIRDFSYGSFTGTASGGGRRIMGMVRGQDDTTKGYWMAGSDGGVYAFGGVKFYGSEAHHPLNAPISGMQSRSNGTGYRLCAEDGGVFCFGNARFKGSLPGIGVVLGEGIKIVDIAGSGNNDGYWLLANDGSVYAFGNAPYLGGHTLNGFPGALAPAFNLEVVSITARPGGGYWTLDTTGDVQAHGCTNYGSTGTLTGDFAVAIEAGGGGTGYLIATAKGAVFAKGGAVYRGGINPGSETPVAIGDNIVVDIARTFDDGGYWLVAIDGGVFVPDTSGTTNNAFFSGSLPEQFSAVHDGNYDDYTDIVKNLLLWSGWWFFNPNLDKDGHNGEGTPPNVFGNLETTGVFAPDNLAEDFFDQKPVIDVINSLKEIVGYIAFVDEIGAFNFRHPNVFSVGNFLSTGEPTSLVPVIDENLQILEYQASIDDHDARSTIIIATDDPNASFSETKSTTITSQWGGDMLRGIIRPALWVNGKFLTPEIQNTMAQLIDLHLFMAQRQGNVTMPAFPLLQIDDQVRIFERSTSETYIHYVRGYRSSMNLEDGTYTMDLQTHWLGDGSGDGWSLTY